jgi:hypothetical protein
VNRCFTKRASLFRCNTLRLGNGRYFRLPESQDHMLAPCLMLSIACQQGLTERVWGFPCLCVGQAKPADKLLKRQTALDHNQAAVDTVEDDMWERGSSQKKITLKLKVPKTSEGVSDYLTANIFDTLQANLLITIRKCAVLALLLGNFSSLQALQGRGNLHGKLPRLLVCCRGIILQVMFCIKIPKLDRGEGIVLGFCRHTRTSLNKAVFLYCRDTEAGCCAHQAR